MPNEYITEAKEWLSFSESDLGVADHLNKTYHPKPLEIICFHCQQAAEETSEKKAEETEKPAEENK